METSKVGFLLFVAVLLLAPLQSPAFSGGSPVCEVNLLPLVPMSPVLRDPPPVGWFLSVPERRWYAGREIDVRLVNADPQRRARGALLWAKSGPLTGAGEFVLPDVVPPAVPRFGYITPSPGNACDQWSVSHVDSQPKTQAQLVFRWRAPSNLQDPFIGMRAFVIDDCRPTPGGCRGAQALTDFIDLVPTLFFDDFE